MIWECRYKDSSGNYVTVWRPADMLPAVGSELEIKLPDQPEFKLRVLRHVYESHEGIPWLRCCKINDEDADQ